MINSAHEAKHIYDELGIDLSDLGCIMAMMTPPEIDLPEEWLYYANDKKRFWIDGVVSHSHVTLKYGLLDGVKRAHVDRVLEGWELDDVQAKDIMIFNSPYDDEPYKCIVLAVESDTLRDANKLLSMLPNVSTFKEYQSHLTLAYVHEDSVTEAVDLIRTQIQGYSPRFIELDYGNKIS